MIQVFPNNGFYSNEFCAGWEDLNLHSGRSGEHIPYNAVKYGSVKL